MYIYIGKSSKNIVHGFHSYVNLPKDIYQWSFNCWEVLFVFGSFHYRCLNFQYWIHYNTKNSID